MYLNADLRKDSGTVKLKNRLVSFLYQLMRDELTPGRVEHIMQEVDKEANREIIYSNGWLAKYAINMADRLTEVEYDRKADDVPKEEDGVQSSAFSEISKRDA